jgi:pSer/pThr/pTyr-binding forkhead associated (FHA) protein
VTIDLEQTLKLGWLVDEHWGKAYPIGQRATIGRGPSNTIILRHEEVSRDHAEVRREGERFVLYTHGASGVKVNGAQAAPTLDLRDGDLLEIAFSLLRFQTTPPNADLMVVPRDTPVHTDDPEGPTRASVKAASPDTIGGSRSRYWRWLVRWLTRRPKTE